MMRRGVVFVLVFVAFVVFVLWSRPLPRIKLEEDIFFPESNADLCLFFVSCNRSSLLRRTVDSVRSHIRRFERNLKVETVLVDQGSTAKSRSSYAAFDFDSVVYTGEARGYGWPFNVGYFGVCRAPYVAVIEDDFPILPNADTVLKRPDVFAHAIELLKGEPDALGVVLKSDHWLLEHGLCEAIPHKIVNGTETFLCKAKVVFGSYTNSAALYDRSKLALIGPQHEGKHGIEDHETPEGRFSLKSKARGMGLLFVERFIAKQEKPFTGVCTHIGGGSSTGGQGSPCRKGENYVLYE